MSDTEISKNTIELALTRILKFIGDDPNREGLIDTPDRIIRSWGEIFAGYNQDPAEIMKRVFVDGACNEMVICRDIDFYSVCEHHFQPFYGRAHIGYIPDGKVVGLSKLARLFDVFARRLQIQEKLTAQVADSIMKYLEPKGCMIVVEAKHLCMLSRGTKKHTSEFITSAIRGVFEHPEVRQEFLGLIK
jgi:GTP cyclohydrolase I